MRDRLIELLKQADDECAEYICNHENAADRIPWYDFFVKILLDNGVIATPVNVGQTVYMIDDYDCEPYVLSVKIDHIKIDKISVWVGLRYPLGIKHTPLVPVEDIGKTVFLTREEAEQALKGGGEG